MVETHTACAHDTPRPKVHLPADKGPAKSGTRVPGETGVWVLIFGNMLAFAVFFVVFMYSRGNKPELFDESRTHLSVGYAVVNTILLLTSSLFVASAVRDFRSVSMDIWNCPLADTRTARSWPIRTAQWRT